MTIRDEIIDELLSGQDPQAVFAKDGLLDALKKALAERILDAELGPPPGRRARPGGLGDAAQPPQRAPSQDGAERDGQAGDRGAARPAGELRAAADCPISPSLPRL